MTMAGGETPIDWAVLVEALRWIGPLSAPDLRHLIDGPEFQITYITYHVTALVREEVLIEVTERPAGASVERLYFFGATA
jgi:hypothetical protein